MYTLMHCHPKRGAGYLTVTLDMAPDDVKLSDDETKLLVTQARKAKRKIGLIDRGFSGTTVFSYDPAHQVQIESHLLASLSTPHTEVQVNASNGNIESWSGY